MRLSVGWMNIISCRERWVLSFAVKFTSFSMFHLRNNVCPSPKRKKVSALYIQIHCTKTERAHLHTPQPYNCTHQSILTHTQCPHKTSNTCYIYIYMQSTHAGRHTSMHTTNDAHNTRYTNKMHTHIHPAHSVLTQVHRHTYRHMTT